MKARWKESIPIPLMISNGYERIARVGNDIWINTEGSYNGSQERSHLFILNTDTKKLQKIESAYLDTCEIIEIISDNLNVYIWVHDTEFNTFTLIKTDVEIIQWSHVISLNHKGYSQSRISGNTMYLLSRPVDEELQVCVIDLLERKVTKSYSKPKNVQMSFPEMIVDDGKLYYLELSVSGDRIVSVLEKDEFRIVSWDSYKVRRNIHGEFTRTWSNGITFVQDYDSEWTLYMDTFDFLKCEWNRKVVQFERNYICDEIPLGLHVCMNGMIYVICAYDENTRTEIRVLDLRHLVSNMEDNENGKVLESIPVPLMVCAKDNGDRDNYATIAQVGNDIWINSEGSYNGSQKKKTNKLEKVVSAYLDTCKIVGIVGDNVNVYIWVLDEDISTLTLLKSDVKILKWSHVISLHHKGYSQSRISGNTMYLLSRPVDEELQIFSIDLLKKKVTKSYSKPTNVLMSWPEITIDNGKLYFMERNLIGDRIVSVLEDDEFRMVLWDNYEVEKYIYGEFIRNWSNGITFVRKRVLYMDTFDFTSSEWSRKVVNFDQSDNHGYIPMDKHVNINGMIYVLSKKRNNENSNMEIRVMDLRKLISNKEVTKTKKVEVIGETLPCSRGKQLDEFTSGKVVPKDVEPVCTLSTFYSQFISNGFSALFKTCYNKNYEISLQ